MNPECISDVTPYKRDSQQLKRAARASMGRLLTRRFTGFDTSEKGVQNLIWNSGIMNIGVIG